MVKEFASFSPCGKTFVSCGLDGKLKLWDTLSGVLKQEFSPNLHLNHPCTSFVWIRLAKSFVSPHKPKKRKSFVMGSDALAIGTNNGIVGIFNIKEGKIVSTLQGGHSNSVSCLAWSKSNELFSGSDSNIAIWDLASKTVKSKWKCGKGNVTCIGVSEGGDFCITGSFKLRIWNVQSKSLVKELTGHSSEITNLQVISGTPFFLSAAANDRSITVWSIDAESEEPVGRFVLEDAVQGEVSLLEDNGLKVRMAATCSSGVLHYFCHQFNGSRSKAVKPVYKIEVASGNPVENGSSKSASPSKSAENSEVRRLPIVAVNLKSPTSASIAYGHSPALTFETVDLKETKESSYLVRSPVVSKPSDSSTKEDTEAMVEDAEYIGGGIVGGSGKRQRDGQGKEVPLEERLNNLSTQDLTALCADSDSNSPHSMAQLLSQALQSKDRALLETVLFRKEISVMKQTIAKLPISLVPSLVRELSTMIQGKALTSSIAAVWLRCLLTLHSSQLLADDQSLQTLSGLHSLVETRLTALPRLFRLSGRLDLLLQQVHGQSAALEIDQPALLVYQDEDSSEEGSCLGGENPEVQSESEDKWDELSDLDTEEMST